MMLLENWLIYVFLSTLSFTQNALRVYLNPYNDINEQLVDPNIIWHGNCSPSEEPEAMSLRGGRLTHQIKDKQKLEMLPSTLGCCGHPVKHSPLLCSNSPRCWNVDTHIYLARFFRDWIKNTSAVLPGAGLYKQCPLCFSICNYVLISITYLSILCGEEHM